MVSNTLICDLRWSCSIAGIATKRELIEIHSRFSVCCCYDLTAPVAVVGGKGRVEKESLPARTQSSCRFDFLSLESQENKLPIKIHN